VNLKEKIPFLDTREYGESPGRVRLLGKLEGVEGFEVSDFNHLITSAIKLVEDKEADKNVTLDDELEKNVTREDLLERHLSYRVKVREGKVTKGGNGDNIVEESSTFKVILRAQRNEAIEINGPYGTSHKFKRAIKEYFNERNGNEITFQDIVSD